MSQSPNKLSIQVKLQPIAPAPETSREEFAIRWGRLAGALGAVVGLIWAFIWFFSFHPVEAPPPEHISQIEALPAMLTASVPPREHAEVTEAPGPLRADEVSAAEVNLAAITLDPPATKAAEGPKAIAARPAIPEAAPGEATVRLLSERITHAQLSRGIRARQPTEVAPAIIDMGEETLITVYLFTELNKLRGTTLYYDWYLEGKRKARVVVRPQLNSMMAYSSKYIDPFMRGNWQVKVQTSAGEPLARGEFEVR